MEREKKKSMIQIPRNKVAVVPIFDSTETHGGIIKASSMMSRVETFVWVLVDNRGELIDENDDREYIEKKLIYYRQRGIFCRIKKKRKIIEGQPMDAGDRCDQGIVKYIGADVRDTRIGDYVFFSGYTGSLVHVEGEGRLIILPEKFLIFKLELDKFIKIPGLYFKSKDGYFEATFEEAMNLIGRAFTDLGLTIDVNSEKPKLEDYNVEV